MSISAWRPRAGRRSQPQIEQLPTHVGVVMDGNRRWARQTGHLSTRVGHRAGAEHLQDLLGWCETWRIEHVTAYVLSADNIAKRSADEVDYLFGLLVDAVPRFIAEMPRWALHVTGDSTLLADDVRAALADSEERSALRPFHVTLAIGYDGRADIAAGIRDALRAVGGMPTPDDITAHLAGGPVKEIDLVIRTGNEQRISGFFPWQTSRAELFFSPKHWPAFTEGDFEKALRHFSDARSRQGASLFT